MKFLWFVLILFCILIGRLLTYDELSYKNGQRIDLEGHILESPEIHSGRQVFHFQGLRLSLDLVPLYSYGDRISVQGVAERREFTSQGKLIEYWEVSEARVLRVESKNVFITFLSGLRNTIVDNIKQALPSPESDLLIGIVLGDDSGFDKKTSDTFSQTGLMHIVAASGTNITIVGGLFYFTCVPLVGLRRAIPISILGISMYALLAGFSPSIQRAAVMGGISYLGLYLGRQTYALFSLVLTGMLLILINPSIVSDIGFQLSFGATLGILLLQPMLQRVPFFSKNLITKDISVTLAAYTALIPLLLYHFNTFTPFAVFINAFVLWTIPILTVLGGIGAIMSLVLSFFAVPIFWVTYPFLHYILFVAHIFSEWLPEYQLTGNISPVFILGYYLTLIAFLIRFRK